MLKSLQNRRLLWLSLLVVLAYCGLGWRLVDLQWVSSETVRMAYEKGAVREYIELPKRGDILDRHGATLTSSVQRYNIGAEPPHIAPYQDRVAALLAQPLQMGVEELTKLLTPETNVTASGVQQVRAFVMLERGASFEQWAAVREIMQKSDFGLDLKTMSAAEKRKIAGLRRFGVRLDSQYETRQYPNGYVAGQILGYVRNQQREFSVGESFNEEVGLAGIERAFNEQLAGAPGFRRIVQTKLTDDADEYLPPADGLNVVLTIDRRVQEILDHELAAALTETGAKAVFGTAMDVNTGEILAMSSAPLFSPADRGDFDASTVRMRPILDEFEPGSIFKVIAISGALQDRAVDLMTPIDCMNGLMPVPGMAPLTDLHGGFGILPVEAVITKSSNIGTAQIVKMDGYDRFYHWLLQYGIGTRTGVGLSEGSGGLRKRGDIYPGEFTRLPIGYGLKVTQLQLATIYSAIANGGRLMQPRIVSRLETRQGKVMVTYQPEVVRRVISEETAHKMIEALRTVTQPGGTAVKAAMDYYTVAGKTGTAHKYNPKIRRYDTEHYYASFIGFFPSTDPQVCIAITVDEPDKSKGHYGGGTAGPIFKKVAEQTAFQLHIKPDRDPNTAPAPSPAEKQAGLDEDDVDQFLLQPGAVAPLRPSAPAHFRISANSGEPNY